MLALTGQQAEIIPFLEVYDADGTRFCANGFGNDALHWATRSSLDLRAGDGRGAALWSRWMRGPAQSGAAGTRAGGRTSLHLSDIGLFDVIRDPLLMVRFGISVLDHLQRHVHDFPFVQFPRPVRLWPGFDVDVFGHNDGGVGKLSCTAEFDDGECVQDCSCEASCAALALTDEAVAIAVTATSGAVSVWMTDRSDCLRRGN